MKDQIHSTKKSYSELRTELTHSQSLLERLKAFGMEAALHQSRFMNFHICYTLRSQEPEPASDPVQDAFLGIPENLPPSLKEIIKMVSGNTDAEIFSFTGSDKPEGDSFEDLIPTMMGLTLLDLMEYKIKEDISRIKEELMTFKID